MPLEKFAIYREFCFVIIAMLFRKKIIVHLRGGKYNLKKNGIYIFFGISLTFVLFAISQIFSRASDLQDALLVFNKIFTQAGPIFMDKSTLTYAIFGLFVLLTKDFVEEFFPDKLSLFNNKYLIVRYISYLVVVFIILYLGVLNSDQFIYFQY